MRTIEWRVKVTCKKQNRNKNWVTDTRVCNEMHLALTHDGLASITYY